MPIEDWLPEYDVRERHERRVDASPERALELAEGDSATYVSGDGGHRHTNLVDGVTRMLIVVRRPRLR